MSPLIFTKLWSDPEVPGHLVLTRRIQCLEIVAFLLFFCMRRPRKRNLEHARRANETILASPLQQCQTLTTTGDVVGVSTIKKYVPGGDWFCCVAKISEPFRSSGKGALRCAYSKGPKFSTFVALEVPT